MAYVMPPNPDWEKINLNGERIVYDLLSDDDIPGYAFYSYLDNLSKDKMIGEIDFIFVCDMGILSIEVKGGKEIFCEGTQWYSISRKDKVNTISNPFKQAKDGRYDIEEFIRRKLGNKMADEILYGYAVIFPETIFTGTGMNLLRDVVFDAKNNNVDFKNFIVNTFNYWREKEMEKHKDKYVTLEDETVEKVIELLRGDFKTIPSMNLEIQLLKQKLIEISDRQYDALMLTDSNDRVVIQGSAGTGKSLLAIEAARRTALAGGKVLYLCFNRNMADYASCSLASAVRDSIEIKTFHSMIHDYIGSLNPQQGYEEIETICKRFLEADLSPEKYDCIIIDEAQDLMLTSVFDVLDKILVNGMTLGKWIMFLDANQNIFNASEEYNFSYNYLVEAFAPTVFDLYENWRNTDKIARKTSVVSLVPPSKRLLLTGGQQVQVRTSVDGKEMIKKFKADLSSLLAGGTSPSNIVVLSKYSLAKSRLGTVGGSICNLKIVENTRVSNWEHGTLNYFTLSSFKGLESDYVFYIDIDGFSSDEDRFANYVAMSRAKFVLYMYYKESLKDEYDEIIDKGYDLFSEM